MFNNKQQASVELSSIGERGWYQKHVKWKDNNIKEFADY
jgi:hypothetical protein